jgi:hypothetical protein
MERLNKLETEMDKLGKEIKEDVKHLEPLPTPSTTISELDQLSRKTEQDLNLVDRSFMMHELASVNRIRDYLSHRGSKVGRENVTVENVFLKEALEKLDQIEADVQRESWTVTTKMGTTMLKQWLRDVNAFQAEIHTFATTSRAFAQEPMWLLTDECSPSLYI